MKNILILTSIYPSSDNPRGFTPIVHYFAKEWVKMGYQVKVIHNQTRFPRLIYYAPNILRKFLEAKLGFAMPVITQTKEKRYEKDGVKIHRIPIYRIFPFLSFFKYSIKRQIQKIITSNDIDQFNPDCILAHWIIPQLPILVKLKSIYNCPGSIVIHGENKINAYVLLKDIDTIGFRSLNKKKQFIRKNAISHKSFMCYSGIDNAIITHLPYKSFSSSISNFVFVGNLIPRKYPDIIIQAFERSEIKDRFSLKIIGDGPMRKKLENYAKIHNLSDKVHFLGHVERQDVFRNLEEAECFIMISKDEVFGLVYIEAMAKGCLVIASKNEEIEGIIVDGVNGFLCKAGDIAELTDIIRKINNLTIEEKRRLSQNAIETAKRLTEKQVAIDYLNQVS